MADEVGTDVTISNRLINCQNLEVLYLIKHDELMTTFAFTLNLFDKYKYSTKVILVLLKFLVTKNTVPVTPGTGCNDIKLPKPLITNIKKLLIDQEKVQDVITGMKNTIMEGKNIAGVVDVNFDRLRNLINPASAMETSETDNLDANLRTPNSTDTTNLLRDGDSATVTTNTATREETATRLAAEAAAARAARRGELPP
jgi:carbon monoxide dehydrogenase subunit G